MIRGTDINNDTFYNYSTAWPDGIDIRIAESGQEQCDPLHYWGVGKKPFYLIHYILSGKGTLQYRGQTFALSGGDGFVITPEHEAFYQADEFDPWHYRWLGISGSQAKIILEMTRLLDSIVYTYDEDDRLDQGLASISEATKMPIAADLSLLGNALLFLAELVKLFPSDKELDISASKTYVDKAIQFMRVSLSEPISITQVAAHVGLNRSYMYRIFIRHTGLSPVAFLEHLRVEYACGLLMEGKLSIQEIAFRAGYNDSSYFSHIFKKTKGVPPTKYTARRL